VLGKDADRFTQQSTLPEQLVDLRIPTLVVHGERDPRPARVARQLAEIIPSASYVELPGVVHLPWLEQPDLLRDVLRRFLEVLP
jgi:proline iminopeptidase